MKKAARWIFLTIFMIEAVLLLPGLVAPEIATVLMALLVGTAIVLVLVIFIPVFSAVRRRLKDGDSISVAVQHEMKEILPKPVLVAVRSEIGLWAAFYRTLRRKKDCPSTATELKYGREYRVMGWVLCAIAPIEILAIGLLGNYYISNGTVRIVIWVVSIYSLLWMVGMLLSTIVYPHYVTPTEMVFRYGNYQTIVIRNDWVTNVTVMNRDRIKTKSIEINDDLMSLNDMRKTNILLTFGSEQHPIVNGEPFAQPIRRFSFWTDEPGKALSLIKEHLTKGEGHQAPSRQ